MAGMGPPPKPASMRRRQNKSEPMKKISSDGQLHGQPLPEGVVVAGELIDWHVITREWWDNWRRSPQSTTFTETDWDTLRDTALMHHQMWDKGRWDFASEVRLRAAAFGATPADRARLKMEVVTGETGPPRPDQGKVTDIRSRRARLSG